jgi:hypothetical protein
MAWKGCCIFQQKKSLMKWPLVLAACWLPLVPGELVLSYSSSSIRAATADYFCSDYPAYNFTDANIVLIESFQHDCQPVVANSSILTRVNEAKNTVVLVDSAMAFVAPAFCHDFRRLAERVHAYWNQMMQASKMQSNMTAMVVACSNPGKRGHTGGPRRYYMSDGFFLPDSAPPFVTAFVGKPDTQRLHAFMRNATEPITMQSLTQDVGEWNRSYRSWLYRSTTMALFLSCTMAILYACYRLYVLKQNGHLSFKRSILVVYLVCMAIAGLELRGLFITPQSSIYYLFNVLVSHISTICLYVILIIWIKRLDKFGIPTLASDYLYILHYSIAVVAIINILYIVPMMVPKPPNALDIIFALCRNALVLIQFACSLVFLVTAVQFYTQMGELNRSAAIYLSNMALINGLVAVSLFLDGTAVLFRTMESYDLDDPWSVLRFYLSLHVRHVFRLCIVLVLLPIGQPSKPSESLEEKE